MKKWSAYVMGFLYVLAGANHFVNPTFYLPMMPPWIPAHELMIALSGVAEIALGLMMFFDRTRRWGAIGIILLLIAIFPANLHMYLERETTFAHLPSVVLLLRLPFQLLFIAWAAVYVRKTKSEA